MFVAYERAAMSDERVTGTLPYLLYGGVAMLQCCVSSVSECSEWYVYVTYAWTGEWIERIHQ